MVNIGLEKGWMNSPGVIMANVEVEYIVRKCFKIHMLVNAGLLRTSGQYVKNMCSDSARKKRSDECR